jgi:NMD protein affecting ribosome stability and mRNA decay
VSVIDDVAERWRQHFEMAQNGPCELCGNHCDNTRRLGWCPDCWLAHVVLGWTPDEIKQAVKRRDEP